MDALEKDYFATMEQDAYQRYKEEHDDLYLPTHIEIDERAKQDGMAFLTAFRKAFPDDTDTEGGELYLERVYGDEVDMSKDIRQWIDKDWSTDATVSIDEAIDGGLRIFFE